VLLAAIVTGLTLQMSPDAGVRAQPAGSGLFLPASAPRAQEPDGEGTIERARVVGVDFAQLVAPGGMPQNPQPGSMLALNLFEDVAYTAVLDRVESSPQGGVTWLGHIEDTPLSQVTLVVNDGVLVGNVTSPEGLFQVRYLGDGLHAVYEIDLSAYPPEAEPVPVDLDEGPVGAADASLADDGSIIDVLVVYTDDARAAAGGTTAIRNLINLAVAETNTSYGNSQMIQRLRLVHAAEFSYGETGDIGTDLGRLRVNGDGYLDSVHSLRNTYHADEVVLLVQNGGPYCGIAYMMSSVSASFEAYAFAVVDKDCATGYYSFAHELGHNMGARHDTYVDSSTTPYAYSHGYVNLSGHWRTIMAYNNQCSDNGFYCTRLQYWSNPGITYGGASMGTANSADNHRTLNNTRVTVANFRVSVQPPSPPSALSATAISQTRIDLAWSDNSTDEGGFKLERSPTGTGSWVVIDLPANTTSFANVGLSPGTTYYYRVRAYRGELYSIYSNLADATTYIVGPVVYDSRTVDDTGGGNGDGLLQCGEQFDLYVKLRNQGSLTAEGITINVSTSDPYVTPAARFGSYGSIPAAGASTNTAGFGFVVAADAPHAHQIRFDLTVTASNGGPWSDELSLLVHCGTDFSYLPMMARGNVLGFDSEFQGTASGWQVYSGEWWIENAEWYTTNGVAAGWASSAYARDWTDLDFEARLWRAGCETCATNLLVRGIPVLSGGETLWDSYYAFQYSRSGTYSVWKGVGGVATPLQGWTASDAIHQGSVWNTLRVVAQGSYLYFYINGALVWAGSDASLVSGRVGIGMHCQGDTSAERLWVDWAKLSSPASGDLQEVSPEQQALNTAVGDQPAGSQEQAPDRE
jgi:hypothetical protein